MESLMSEQVKGNGFGPDLQRVLRALAITLNSLHKRCRFHGNIDEASLFDNIIVNRNGVELKTQSRASMMNPYSGMLKDLKGFIDLIKYIGDKHKPNGMSLPIEYNQFLDLINEFQSLLNQTNLEPRMYGDFREAEFWIFSFPVFLTPHEKCEYIEKVWSIKREYEDIFNRVKLSEDPYWLTSITNQKFLETARRATNPVTRYCKYHNNPTGRFQYFHYSIDRSGESGELPNTAAQYFHDTFPYAFGEMHIALYKYLPENGPDGIRTLVIREFDASFVGIWGLARARSHKEIICS
ncbi:hypothetical protein COLO4_31606 [Corchorus olitorius]|uniref:Uncharacterized protein n=1 Tax=Corchorus olitorius TaxID=93759 RepID=A0A1R3H3U7_9ROSI|nr:hypothetical protein COLO4_31606 [Corchorus olitorius]